MKYLVLIFSIITFTAFAQKEYINDPALHIHKPNDTLSFNRMEIKKVLGKPGQFEAYWDIKGPYINNTEIHLRRMKFYVDCNNLNVALSTIALGGKEGHMIQIILIPQGTEEWMPWQEVSFISTDHLSLICPGRVI